MKHLLLLVLLAIGSYASAQEVRQFTMMDLDPIVQAQTALAVKLFDRGKFMTLKRDFGITYKDHEDNRSYLMEEVRIRLFNIYIKAGRFKNFDKEFNYIGD